MPRPLHLILVCAAAVAVSAERAAAQIPSADGVFYGCVRLDRDGDEGRQLRLVTAGEPCCRNETRVHWNQKGKDGVNGKDGSNGTTGGMRVVDAHGTPVGPLDLRGGGNVLLSIGGQHWFTFNLSDSSSAQPLWFTTNCSNQGLYCGFFLHTSLDCSGPAYMVRLPAGISPGYVIAEALYYPGPAEEHLFGSASQVDQFGVQSDCRSFGSLQEVAPAGVVQMMPLWVTGWVSPLRYQVDGQ